MSWSGSIPYYTYTIGPRGLSFSEEEKRHLYISIVVLTLSLTLALSGGLGSLFFYPPYLLLRNLIVAFGAISSGFFLHELGHKATAQRYGCWAEFRMWSFGLLLAVFSGLLGVLFAAPGAVYISGYITREQNGKISASGPGINLTIAFFLTGFLFFSRSAILWSFLYPVAYINTFLALFNLLPIGPLDGSKIYRWSPQVYLILFVCALALFILLLTAHF